MKTLGIIGLGKLGAPMLAVFAAKGFKVVGVDSNPAYVDAINAHRAPVVEPRLQEYLTQFAGRYVAHGDTEKSVSETDATFVIVPTPTGEHGGFVLDHVYPVCEAIGRGLAQKDTFHLVVIVSTVMPGDMKKIKSCLELVSRKRCGEDFGLCYSPEFIALGSVIENMEHPDYALIGSDDEDSRSGVALSMIYYHVHDAPMVHMNFVNAEIAKIAQNSFITLKITFANQLSALCEQIPGANVDRVVSALGCDHRIGRACLTGGIGFGGPCFPRDNRALARVAAEHKTVFPLATLVDRLNRDTILPLMELVKRYGAGRTIGVIGLAYKSGTPVTEESIAVKLVQYLSERGFKLVVYDPLVRLDFDHKVVVASSPEQCVDQSEVIVLMLPVPDLVSPTQLEHKIVIDPWRILRGQVPTSATYIPLGVGPNRK